MDVGVAVSAREAINGCGYRRGKLRLKMEKVSSFMEGHAGREKLLRLMQYTAVLVSGVTSEDRLYNVAGRISTARTLLRLFDDAAMMVCAQNTLQTLDVCILFVYTMHLDT